ncbi:CCNQ-like protein, partial [Mya arenaria]
MGDNEGLVHFRVVRFIYEAGMKLRMKTIPLSTTCVLYHRFFRENKLDDFDPYLIAATCLYLAGKVEEEQHISLRDVVNDWFDPVTWSTFPLTRTCWGILRDTYHSPLALRYKPQHIAIAVLYFSILCHGLEVPHNRTADRPWWK